MPAQVGIHQAPGNAAGFIWGHAGGLEERFGEGG
jgi:hypothetical protein